MQTHFRTDMFQCLHSEVRWEDKNTNYAAKVENALEVFMASTNLRGSDEHEAETFSVNWLLTWTCKIWRLLNHFVQRRFLWWDEINDNPKEWDMSMYIRTMTRIHISRAEVAFFNTHVDGAGLSSPRTAKCWRQKRWESVGTSIGRGCSYDVFASFFFSNLQLLAAHLIFLKFWTVFFFLQMCETYVNVV